MTVKQTPPPPLSKETKSPAPAKKQISGTGEMADLIRVHDWASTPLGPIDIWSEALLCSVNLMLSCQFPTVVFWGPEMIQFYNDGYRPLMAEKHPTALGQSARECWKEAWHLIGPQWEAVLASGETTYMKEVLVPVIRNGRLQDIYWTYSYSPIFNSEGTVDGILIVCHDVTDEVLAIRRLRESEARTAVSEERLRLALAAANGVGIWDWDVANDLVYADEGFAHLYGVDPQKAATGITIAEFMRNIHPDDRNEVQAAINSALCTDEEFKSEYRIYQIDGSVRWVAAVGRCSFEPGGAPARFPGITIDITERKQTEAALIQSEKLAAVGRLASSIAHEINNPLESVTNLIYLARQHAVDPDAQRFLDTADQEIRRVSIIANQTLRFHKQPSNPQAISCSELLSTVLSIYEGKLKNAGIEVEKRKRAVQPVVCFEGDIRQILNNLVGNAIDAMPSGGRLLVRSREATDWSTGRKGLTLTIADTGIGMDAAVLQRIFDPFFTTKGIAGTGLGLWVSQEIAERHKGKLKVRSSRREGRSGTVFTLFLPSNAATE